MGSRLGRFFQGCRVRGPCPCTSLGAHHPSREQRRLLSRLERARHPGRAAPYSWSNLPSKPGHGAVVRGHVSQRQHPRRRRRTPSPPHPAPSLDLRASKCRAAAAPVRVLCGLRAVLRPPIQPRARRQLAAHLGAGGGRVGRGCACVSASRCEGAHIGDHPDPAAVVPPADGRLGPVATPTPPAIPHTTPGGVSVVAWPGPDYDAGWRSDAAFTPSQRVTTHLQLGYSRTLRARVADSAVPSSRDPRAMACVLIPTWQGLLWHGT